MKTDKLSNIDQDSIYRAFEQLQVPTNNLIGQWAIFRNNRIIVLNGEISYPRRNEATLYRNQLISQIYTWDRNNEDIYTLRVGVIPNTVIVTLRNPITKYIGHQYFIRGECPELFERLTNLFIVRQITLEDLSGIVNVMSGG